ncbi:MAG TPA: aquaporin [Turneriella sp.]|nr:aquaporin [Turneriella sp.]HMY10864.1 aquaporin [Turneriella sp.]HNE18477.1 aquaporin [Turneriella sp.]HNJ65951.1 aquaporin [Turneriella sp.]HNL09095.1 aquaporin [Turneriella sp.]
MKVYIAEIIGTATLVLFGCGSAVFAGASIGIVGISFSFGLALLAMAYAIGPISGCHINPAVSVGAYIAGRLSGRRLVGYVIAQSLGAIVGAALVYAIALGDPAYKLAVNGLGQNGFGPGYQGGFNLESAFLFEAIATFIFLVVILGSTSSGAAKKFAGIAIGLSLVLIHLVGIRITGVSVNPARSLGPALFVGGQAMAQLWVFIVAPLLGAAFAGLMYRGRVLED